MLESETANPLMEAAEVNDTEQEVLPGVFIVVLVQLRILREGPGTGREIAPEPPLAGMEAPPAVEATTPVS